MWQWIKDEWMSFETWVHSWFPGLKTRITSALGAVGSAAIVLQQFVTGLPVTKWISAELLQGVTLALFCLSFWFSNMGARIENYEKQQ